MPDRKKKILFIVQHRKNRSPGQRFRFEQYLDALEKHFEITYSYILSEKDDKIFYSKRNYIQKFIILLKSLIKRYKDLKRAADFDVILIYREAIMLGNLFFEKRLVRSGAKIVFDFDDAIWLKDISAGNQSLSWLKNPAKTAGIICLSDMVFAGNKYLAVYAKQFNQNVKIVPTTIDMNYHKKVNHLPKNKICIGWTGTSTTLKHFKTALPVLKKLKIKYGEKIFFKIICDVPFEVQSLDIKSEFWKLDKEIEQLSEFDIGIMPLPDDIWSKGKCGFKGLQYMALEIPAVLAAVGVNNEIIRDGINGFLASSAQEWESKLSRLIESKELREKTGKEGKKTIEKYYSKQSQQEKYVNHFIQLCFINNDI